MSYSKHLEVLNNHREFVDLPNKKAYSQVLPCYLRRLYLNSGGYTPEGEYFGGGAPLYAVEVDYVNDDFTYRGYTVIRAYSREDAKIEAREFFHNVEIKFFR